MTGPKRTYEDYEELARHLDASQEALYEAQKQLLDMFGTFDLRSANPRPTTYDLDVLGLVLRFQKLREWLARQAYADIEESDVPEGKPRIPEYFTRSH